MGGGSYSELPGEERITITPLEIPSNFAILQLNKTLLEGMIVQVWTLNKKRGKKSLSYFDTCHFNIQTANISMLNEKEQTKLSFSAPWR